MQLETLNKIIQLSHEPIYIEHNRVVYRPRGQYRQILSWDYKYLTLTYLRNHILGYKLAVAAGRGMPMPVYVSNLKRKTMQKIRFTANPYDHSSIISVLKTLPIVSEVESSGSYVVVTLKHEKYKRASTK